MRIYHHHTHSLNPKTLPRPNKIMIPLIPAVVITGAFVVGMVLYAGDAIIELQDLRNDAATNTQERLQERLRGEYEGSPTNIQQATVLSEWTDDTMITGVMVKCVSGEVFTIDTNVLVRGGELVSLNRTLMDDMQRLASGC